MCPNALGKQGKKAIARKKKKKKGLFFSFCHLKLFLFPLDIVVLHFLPISEPHLSVQFGCSKLLIYSTRTEDLEIPSSHYYYFKSHYVLLLKVVKGMKFNIFFGVESYFPLVHFSFFFFFPHCTSFSRLAHGKDKFWLKRPKTKPIADTL